VIISTRRIYDAISYYSNLGYKMIDVPMIVSEESINETVKCAKEVYKHPLGCYVGSAEQSFIEMHKQGNLPVGKYMALTPCWRDESVIDETHFNLFLKLELIDLESDTVNGIIKDCLGLFVKENKGYDRISITTDIVDNEIIHDININNIEVGSYGCREMLDGTSYTYGTGIAEPRITYALTKEK